MELIKDWDEPTYRDIAKKSESKQAVLDVKHTRLLYWSHKGIVPYSIRYEDKSMLMAYFTRASCRVIGIATDKQYQGQGLAGRLLKVTEIQASRRGIQRIYTVTTEGRAFYEKYGYTVTGRREKGWELTKKI